MPKKFPIHYPIRGPVGQSNTTANLKLISGDGVQHIVTGTKIPIYSVVKSEVYWHPSNTIKDTLVFKVEPLFIGAQQYLGVHTKQIIRYITYSLSPSAVAHLKATLFTELFTKQTKVYQNHIRHRNKLLGGTPTETEARVAFEQRFNKGQLRLPVSSAKVIGHLRKDDHLVCRFHAQELKSIKSGLHTIPIGVIRPILEQLVDDKNKSHINNSAWLGFTITSVDSIYIKIKSKPLYDLESFYMVLSDKEGKTYYPLENNGGNIKLGTKQSGKYNRDKPTVRASLKQSTFQLAFPDLPVLTYKQLYLSLLLSNTRTHKNGYFVPGFITHFWNERDKKEFKQAFYKGIDLTDSDPLVPNDQPYSLHLNPNRFKEGEILVYRNDHEGCRPFTGELVLEIGTTLGFRETYVLQRKEHQDFFHYRIYQTSTVTDIKLGIVQSHNPLKYETQSFNLFNLKKQRLADFLSNKVHIFFLDPIPVRIKPNIFYKTPTKQIQVPLENNTIWIEGRKKDASNNLHKGQLKDGLIDISPYIDIRTGYHSPIVCLLSL
ncbi:MAG: hypothetical protein AAF242_16785, partial [Bacteroidota bacterium]